MHIGLDARFLSHPQAGGFKSYTEGLVEGLLAQLGAHRLTLYVDRPLGAAAEHALAPARCVVIRGTGGPWAMPWREQWRLPRRATADGLDLLHSPCATAPVWGRSPLVVTLHDAIGFMECSAGRAGLPRPKLLHHTLIGHYFRRVQRWAARRARFVITDSICSRRDLERYLALDPAKIRVIPPSQAERYRPATDAEGTEIRQALNLPDRFLLGMASADPRKNAAGLLRAYATLPVDLRAICPIILICLDDQLAQSLAADAAALGLTDSLRLLPRQSDRTLLGLYQTAAVFAFPSLYEGFGLPVLEAMASGAVVVAADRGALPEIAGSAAILADPEDSAAFGSALARVLSDESLHTGLRQEGLRHAGDYSWRRTARATLEVYVEALGLLQ